MARSLDPFLMFDGKAEEAARFYIALFRDAALLRLEKYGPGELGDEGSVKIVIFTIAGREVRCLNSPVKHPFTFTPSLSLFVECETEAELELAFNGLADGGTVLMPLDNYGFSKQFAWVNDRFGVSWQLNFSG